MYLDWNAVDINFVKRKRLQTTESIGSRAEYVPDFHELTDIETESVFETDEEFKIKYQFLSF